MHLQKQPSLLLNGEEFHVKLTADSSGRTSNRSLPCREGRQIPGTLRITSGQPEAEPEPLVLEILPGRELEPEVKAA